MSRVCSTSRKNNVQCVLLTTESTVIFKITSQELVSQMAVPRTLIVGFKSTRELKEDEIDIDEDVDDIEKEFDFSDNGMYLKTLMKKI